MIVIICSKRSLIKAADKGDLKAVEKHLKSRFFKKSWLAGNRSGFSALYMATFSGHTEIIKLLLAAGSDPDMLNGGHWTPLAVAAEHGHLAIVNMLLSDRANPNALCLPWNMSPLHYTAKFKGGTPAIAQTLIKAGARIDARDHEGNTPLLLAIENDKADIVDILLKSGAKTDVTNNKGQTVWGLAKQKDMLDVFKRNGLDEPKPPAPAPSAPAAPEKSWVMIDDDKIAHVETFPDLQTRMVEVFNFSARVVQTTQEDLETRAKTPMPNIEFASLALTKLRQALDEFVKQGGEADENFVMTGRPTAHKPIPERSVP